MQGLDVVGPVILEQELVKDRNRRVYIIKQYKQREKIRNFHAHPVPPRLKVIYSKATRYYGDDAVRLPT